MSILYMFRVETKVLLYIYVLYIERLNGMNKNRSSLIITRFVRLSVP